MTPIKSYFGNLDALRFLAACGVITGHVSNWLVWPETELSKWIRIVITLDGSSGWAGVSFFFTLSGFLITFLMFKERETTGKFRVGSFYVRRALRIWPLYFFTLFLGFAVYPAVSGIPEFVESADWRMYVLFLANFDYVYSAVPLCWLLMVQWSIAVEEQFYLVWPFIFKYAGNKLYFHWLCLVLIAGSIAFHISGGHEYHTLTAVNDLAVGALAAYGSVYHLPRIELFFQRLGKSRTYLVYAAGLFFLFGHFQIVRMVPYYAWIDHAVNSIFFAFIILEQNYSPCSFFKFGSIALFGWLGRISYGIYLLHVVAIFIVVSIAATYPMPVGISVVLVLLFTVMLSSASYRYLETPFLNLKEKFREF